MDETTTREHIEESLRRWSSTPTGLSEEFEIDVNEVLEHVSHISKSLENTDEELLVIPPECRDCGFNNFDKLLNIPSRCPSCKSEGIKEPVFKIEKRG